MSGAPLSARDAGLSIVNLRKSYDNLVAVDDLTLEVARGELVAFLGPSGCGKTTSLRMIAGLIPASGGRILVEGRDITHRPVHLRDIGLVFQSYALFPHLSVERNIAFGLEMRKLPRAEIARRVKAAIALVRLEGREHRRPSELSGGQQQRVALARALIIEPSLLLFDEPLSNLDAKLRDEMRNEIRDIQKKLGITSIFVTHDQVEALTMCDRIAVLNHGRLEQIGTPRELFETPATPFVASFIGRTNRLSGMAQGRTVRGEGWQMAVANAHEGPVEVMIRPHLIRLASPEAAGAGVTNTLSGTVARLTYAGETLQIDVDIGGGVLVSLEQSNTEGSPDAAPGRTVTLAFRAADILVFPRAA